MKKRVEYIIEGEKYLYDKDLNIVINTALEDIPNVIFVNKIQNYIGKHDLTITIYGEGDHETGLNFECKVKRGFNEILYEAEVCSNRTIGVVDCYNWIIRNKLI